jgi:lipoate---protein ligase
LSPRAEPEWEFLELTGTAGQIHEWRPDHFARRINLCRVSTPAVVLGSTQPESSLDRTTAQALGLEVVRRRSGGGAVVVRSGSVLWVTVDLPAGDPLWQDDLGRSFLWLGEAWANALAAAGAEAPEVHQGPPVRTEWSSALCFAGLGAGEVKVAGRKAVGLAQRRVRGGAMFHCAALLEWDPVEAAALAAGAPDWLAEALTQFAGPCGVNGAVLLGEFRQALASVRPDR